MLYNYETIITNIVDGDTIDCHIDLGFDQWMYNARVRLIDIDCPEIRTTDLKEKHYGKLAKEFVESCMPIGSVRILRSIEFRRDSFARILGDFQLPNERWWLCDYLIDSYHAVPWSKNKELMNEFHMINREKLNSM